MAYGISITETGEVAPRVGVICYFPHSSSEAISFETLIQSDLPQYEMTGDPLLNMEGQALGVNVFFEPVFFGASFITLSIPSHIVQEVVDRLMDASITLPAPANRSSTDKPGSF